MNQCINLKAQKISAQESPSRTAVNAAFISIACNIFLAGIKLIAAFLCGAGAMLSDGIHSLCDVCSNLIVIIGVKLAAKPPDRSHPFGHDRFESVSAILLSTVLLITGIFLGKDACTAIVTRKYNASAFAGTLPIIIATISIFCKECIYRILKNIALRCDSSALLADAWHHRSDALSSVGALLGIAGTKLGFPICDSLASLLICFFILKASIDIFRDAVQKITDHSCSPELEAQLLCAILSCPGVENVSMLRKRTFGSGFYAEAEIITKCTDTLPDIYHLVLQVQSSVRKNFPKLKDIYIQVHPNTLYDCV